MSSTRQNESECPKTWGVLLHMYKGGGSQNLPVFAVVRKIDISIEEN